ncbi:MAG: hypothetical protein RLZZ200_2578 [Pseudomonadota bacterium]|jgi:hypothetical protein
MTTLKLLNTAQQPAGEQDLVEATLAFANGSDVELNGVLIPPAPAGFNQAGQDLWGFQTEGDPAAATWETVWRETQERLRGDLQNRLAQVLTQPDAAAAQALRAWRWPRAQPVIRMVPGGLRLAVHYPLAGVEDLCDLGLALILDVERGRRADLCRCQLESCGRYFFVDRGASNRPRTRYCSPAHMLAFHGGERGAARVRKHRAKRPRPGSA